MYYDILGDAFDILHTSVSTDMHIYKRSGTNDFAAYAIDRSINLAAIFAKHKSIKVEGSQNRAFDGYFKIKGTDIFTGCIYFGRADSDFSFESESFTTISTDVPPLEGACVCQNRIFGYVHNQIYACALGDGGNWCEYYTDNGAFKLDGAVGDAFTACDCVDGQCVFFTEHNVYKLYGDGVLDYSLRMMSDLGGIKPEIGKAHAKALGHIYYICKNQLMRFSGIMSERVCTLRDKNIYKSYLVAVNDKLYIYYNTDGGIRICMLDVKSLSLYDLTVQNLTAVSGFIEHADVACIVSYGKLVAINATSGEGLSSFTRDVNICSSVEFDEIHNAHQRFTPTRLCLRGGAFDGGEVKIYCKLGTGEWREVGVIFGDEDKLWEFTLPSQKTDSLRLRLDGNGRFEIRNIYALYA